MSPCCSKFSKCLPYLLLITSYTTNVQASSYTDCKDVNSVLCWFPNFTGTKLRSNKALIGI